LVRTVALVINLKCPNYLNKCGNVPVSSRQITLREHVGSLNSRSTSSRMGRLKHSCIKALFSYSVLSDLSRSMFTRFFLSNDSLALQLCH